MSKVNGTVVSTPLAQVTTPLLALALPQGGTVPPSLVELDRAVGGVVGRAITSGDFKGKRDESALLYPGGGKARSEEHTSELQSLAYLVCRLLLEKKKNKMSRDMVIVELRIGACLKTH